MRILLSFVINVEMGYEIESVKAEMQNAAKEASKHISTDAISAENCLRTAHRQATFQSLFAVSPPSVKPHYPTIQNNKNVSLQSERITTKH